MYNSIINIGKIIKDDINARIKYHPMIEKINLGKYNIKDKKFKFNDNLTFCEIFIDIDNDNFIINDNIIYNDEKLTIFNYRNSKADNKLHHLIGNNKYTLEKFKIKLFSYEYFIENYNYDIILNENSFINKYRKIFDKNLNKFKLYIDTLPSKNEIILLIKIKYNNEEKLAHEFIECINEIDEIFLIENKINDDKYTFYSSFYSAFNLKKFSVKKK